MKGIVSKEGACRLLHYRQIGGIQRELDRHAEYRTRMSLFNTENGFGIHYLHSDEEKKMEWNHLLTNARELW